MPKVAIREMRKAGEINRKAIKYGFEHAKIGVTPFEIDQHIDGYIRYLGGTPAFKGYRGFPAASCISINNETVHTIPGNRKIDQHDVVTIDVGTKWAGAIVDAAETRIVGQDEHTPQAYINLLEGGRRCLEAVERILKAGVTLWAIADACQKEADITGVTILPQFTGHGVGADVHMEPSIFNTTRIAPMMLVGLHETTLEAGDTVCIEPIVKIGPSTNMRKKSDGWTIVTADGNHSAHFEHTILITEDGCEVLC